MQGVDKILDREGLSTNIEAMFQSVDIFSDNMEILLNSFVSPLSSSLGTSFYKYYIMDTVQVAGRQCTELAFVPVNSESFGFTGYLYIDTDGSYSLRKYSLNIPSKINLNFVSNLSITQEYSEQSDGMLVPTRNDTYVNFFIFKNMRQIYAHQTKIIDHYDFDVSESELSAAMAIQGPSETLPDATKLHKSKWAGIRPEALSKKESVLDSLVIELEKIPKFRHAIRAGEILISGSVLSCSTRVAKPTAAFSSELLLCLAGRGIWR